jgi:dipeptidyl aminopeptidase/acylaminoacyl peptidase
VNYGGSSGFGRKYIKRLEGNWGIVDVMDCASAVKQLPLDIDLRRIAIRGGSSGGYTTLAMLANAPKTDQELFSAGTSYYGISNLELLAKDSEYIAMILSL